MKNIITIFSFIICSFAAMAQFQPLKESDWTLWDRSDHKMHMFVGQVSMVIPQLTLTYADMDNPDFVKPLKYTLPISLGLVIGKEYIWDRAFGLGSPTYPDFIYGITGVATGLLFSYGVYRFERWHINKHEKLKL